MMSGRFHRVFGKFAAPDNSIASEALGPVLPTVDGCSRPDADEAPEGVRLPASDFHNLGKGGAVRSLHHGDDHGLLVGAMRFRLADRRLIGPARLLRGLGFLGEFPLALGRSSRWFRRASVR